MPEQSGDSITAEDQGEPLNDAPNALPSHIGQDLKDAREAAGLSQREISESLRIQPAFIDAIETLNTDALPSIGYVLGYVRAYAQKLGLNPQECVERYKIDSEVPENLGMRTMPHFVPQRQLRLPRGFFAAITVMSFAAILAIWYGAQNSGKTAALQGETRLNTPAAGTSEAVPVDPNLMTFKATAPTWVQIKDSGGKVIISRILVTGESWQTDVDNNVSLSARDSGALELYIGGELMGNLGKKGIPMMDVPMPAVPRDGAQTDSQEDIDPSFADDPQENAANTLAPDLTAEQDVNPVSAPVSVPAPGDRSRPPQDLH